MPTPKTYSWQPAPFIRLLPPLIAGILVQWHLVLSPTLLVISTITCSAFLLLYGLSPLKTKFLFRYLAGAVLLLSTALTGAWLVHFKDVRNNAQWIGQESKENYYTVVHLNEPLVRKPNTFKAIAEAEGIVREGSLVKTKGKIIIYFKNDTSLLNLGYGSTLIIYQPLQGIQNSGNPAGFDYKRYALFGGITHQVYLKPGQYEVLPGKNTSFLGRGILACREAVISSLRTFIKSPKELGLAEALLIGYKDDLDKNLVQSYSNTGVVHIIAISGLHLGLIYLLLVRLTRPLVKMKRSGWARFLIIVLALWGFSLVAGAQPSVLRSAVMFSCIALGELIGRKSAVYNTLALSAFILLCINPFWLWDVGFQLSYTAVLSIVIFFRPVYHLFYIQNKGLDAFWKLNAVTIAAQVLTLPLLLFHFHQFPLLFLVANMVAVPLSSGILLGELFLLLVSFIPWAAARVGAVVEHLVRFMNAYVERLDRVHFSVWNGFSLSTLQVLLLYGFICALAYWLLEKKKNALSYSLFCLLLFAGLRTHSFILANKQTKLIVYNVPGHQAIDVIEGRRFKFMGDKDLMGNTSLRNFHLQPARLQHRVSFEDHLPAKSFRLQQKQFMIIDTAIAFYPTARRPVIDALILSRNPKIYLNKLCKALTVNLVVMDGSVPAWKKKLWKKDCLALNLPYYDVTERGAFEMKLQ